VDTVRAGGITMIAGSLVFLIGAAIGVPRIFTEPDADTRLRMLEARPGAWRVAQPLYGLGALIAGVGVGIAAAGTGGAALVWLALACAALVAGALAWCWSVYLRGMHVRDFVYGRLPWWPFATYVLLTVAGLALLGAGLLAGAFPAWLGWVTLAADAVFLAAYLLTRDIPPFVFYLLLPLVGGFLAR
jgi:hypothetical protein